MKSAALSVELTPDVSAVLVLTLLVLNAIALIAFGIDKVRAEAGAQRFAECILRTLAALGAPWAPSTGQDGRSLFRHKTRKQPFGRRLFVIAALQLAGLSGLVGWALSL